MAQSRCCAMGAVQYHRHVAIISYSLLVACQILAPEGVHILHIPGQLIVHQAVRQSVTHSWLTLRSICLMIPFEV